MYGGNRNRARPKAIDFRKFRQTAVVSSDDKQLAVGVLGILANLSDNFFYVFYVGNGICIPVKVEGLIVFSRISFCD